LFKVIMHGFLRCLPGQAAHKKFVCISHTL
jgi:hypothetical protein